MHRGIDRRNPPSEFPSFNILQAVLELNQLRLEVFSGDLKNGRVRDKMNNNELLRT